MPIDRRQLEKDGVYEAKAAIGTLLSELDQIAALARAAEVEKRRLKKLGGFIAIASCFGIAFGAEADIAWLPFASLATLCCGVWLFIRALVSGKAWRNTKRLDIVKERLSMIQADAGAERPFSLRLVLASKPKTLRVEPWRGRKSGQQEFWEEPWLTMEGPLLDGTVLTDAIKELSRKRTYINPTGKRKTKRRVTYQVDVCFSYSRERFGDVRPVHQAMREGVKVSPNAMLKRVRVTEKAIDLRAMVKLDEDVAKTAGMLSMGAYRMLNLARRVNEKKRGTAK